MSVTKRIRGWTRVSPRWTVHGSGFRIGRQGPTDAAPDSSLVSGDRSVPPRRFAPIPEGFGESPATFARHQAVLQELVRIMTID